MPDKTLHEAAEELHQAVEALKELLEREYPDRVELEENYISKTGNNKRWVVVITMILFASLVAFLLTVSTVSQCFLREDQPDACNLLPGYPATMERNDSQFKRFERLEKITEDNQRRIRELER